MSISREIEKPVFILVFMPLFAKIVYCTFFCFHFKFNLFSSTDRKRNEFKQLWMLIDHFYLILT